jgi:hypothetical protein
VGGLAFGVCFGEKRVLTPMAWVRFLLSWLSLEAWPFLGQEQGSYRKCGHFFFFSRRGRRRRI